VARTVAILADVDGTLVDNTAEHIAAWRHAFQRLGFSVDDEALRRQVGKGGDLYVAAVAGKAWDRAHGDLCRRFHASAIVASLGSVGPTPGVHAFLCAARTGGRRLVLATSSGSAEVGLNLARIRTNQSEFTVVNKDQVQTSKPAPDAVARALERSGRIAAEAVMVGDTRWDGEAAARAGVAFWGVLCGAGTRAELTASGASHVYADLGELTAAQLA
jgi:phosphoglycolate phosphatase-like HAD superfamily hydrolase